MFRWCGRLRAKINSMKGNQQFEDLILQHFGDVMQDYDLEIRNVRWDEIQMYNDKCIVRFIYMEGMVVCDFIDPEVKKAREAVKRKDGFPSGFPVYSIYSVQKLLYPDDKTDYSSRDQTMEAQIISLKKQLLERFTHVLKGDFSWTTLYR